MTVVAVLSDDLLFLRKFPWRKECAIAFGCQLRSKRPVRLGFAATERRLVEKRLLLRMLRNLHETIHTIKLWEPLRRLASLLAVR